MHCPSKPGRWIVAALLAGTMWLYPLAQAEAAAELTPTMALEDIRPGMEGYGLTVFHGTAIEPFPVEVVSVAMGFRPGGGVIWIRCLDERMALNGPVQGMSGSPIFLWPKGEEREPGKGGLLIGAFAFGFPFVKTPLAGVQPIAYMRGLLPRLNDERDQPALGGRPGDATTALMALMRQMRQTGDAAPHWRAAAIAKLLGVNAEGDAAAAPAGAWMVTDLGAQPMQAQPLSLPVQVGSAELAAALTPMFAAGGSGLAAWAAPVGVATSKPPVWLDVNAIPMAPGGVLAVPLCWGDIEMAANGTITDVGPDGRLLGFGHPMMNEGDTALPMASGYVHMVVPRITTSFKYADSAMIRGTLLRDEAVAVAGVPGQRFTTARAAITVRIPRQPPRQYQVTIAHHRRLTPAIAAAAVAQAVGADQGQPRLSTLKLDARLRFEGGRTLNVQSLLPRAAATDLMMELVPPITTMIDNAFQSMMLEEMVADVELEPVVRLGSLAQVTLDRTEVEPGENLGITLRIQPYAEPAITRQLNLRIPPNADEGQFPVVVCGSRHYGQLLVNNRPHLLRTASRDELLQALERLLALPDDAVYAVLQLPQQGLAVRQTELEHLPSSRAALLASEVSTVTTSFPHWEQAHERLGMVVDGQAMLRVQIKRQPASP